MPHKNDSGNISNIKVRSKPVTKRLQIHTDDERILGIENRED